MGDGMESPRPRRWRFVLPLLALLFGLSILADRALGLFGVPRDSYAVAPPPDFEVVIDNIEYAYTFVTNDRGLRYRTIPAEKPAGERRIILLGDSYAEGLGVVEGKRWADLLEEGLSAPGKPVRVINCGESGTGPVNYGQKLFHIGVEYDPDAVLLCVSYTDVPDSLAESDPTQMFPGWYADQRTGLRRLFHSVYPHTYVLLSRALGGGEVHGQEMPQEGMLAELENYCRRNGIPRTRFDRWSRLVPKDLVEEADKDRIVWNVLTHPLTRLDYYEQALDLETTDAPARFASLCRVLDRIAKECRGRGLGFGVVYIPAPCQYDPGSFERATGRLFEQMGRPWNRAWLTGPSELQKRLRAWAGKGGIAFLDLGPAFQAAVRNGAPPLCFPIDGHWNEEGGRLAEKTIRAWLAAGGVFEQFP